MSPTRITSKSLTPNTDNYERKGTAGGSSPPKDISIYVEALTGTYRPASSPAEAAHFFSTEEVVETIKELYPSARVSVGQVFKPLWEAGFRICNCPGPAGMALRWMFREKGILTR